MADAPSDATCAQGPPSTLRSTSTAERGVVVVVAPFDHETFTSASLALLAEHALGAAGADQAMWAIVVLALAVAPLAYGEALGQ